MVDVCYKIFVNFSGLFYFGDIMKISEDVFCVVKFDIGIGYVIMDFMFFVGV